MSAITRDVRLAALTFALILSACATGSRLHPDHVPAGSLRVAQVVDVIKGDSAFRPEEKPVYEILSQGGLSDSEIRQGSVALARVLCCGVNEKVNAIVFFAPATIEVAIDDVVEVRAGRAGDPKAINVATRIRQKSGGATTCRWVPDDPRLATRVLYCDGMKEERWVQQSGLWNFWVR